MGSVLDSTESLLFERNKGGAVKPLILVMEILSIVDMIIY
jgi:hypothetical protein